MIRRSDEASSADAGHGGVEAERRYKGVRRRRWGKWVSEIRVPGSRDRLWLGSYSTPEAAAVAHDTAVFLLKGPSSSSSLNFPNRVYPAAWAGGGMSPRSVQRVASDSGMAADAQLLSHELPRQEGGAPEGCGRNMGGGDCWGDGHDQLREGDHALDISVDDMEMYL